MEVSFYLKRPDAKEPTAIFARISYFGNQMKYYPSIKIHPKFWNKDTRQVRQTLEGYANFNRRLADITRDAEDLLTLYQNKNNGEIPAPDTLKELLDVKLKNITPKAEKHTLLTFFAQLIEDSKKGTRINPKTKKPIASSTVKSYVTCYRHLTEFQTKRKKKIDFNNIDLEFYADYSEYLIKILKLSTNTVGKNIKGLKLVMNEAYECGLNTNMAYKSKKFIKLTEKVDSIYLNESELSLIGKLDLSKEPKLDRVRDLFLVGCYTGLRFSDFSVLRPDQIKDGFIETTQIKTGDTVVIPVHDKVEAILQKYNGVLPRAISNQKTNDYIKDIVKKIPEFERCVPVNYTKAGLRVTENVEKFNMVTTHTARRSFATNEYIAGTPAITIMAITGHKTESAFMKYIKTTPKEQAEILKATWAQRRRKTNGKTKVIALTA